MKKILWLCILFSFLVLPCLQAQEEEEDLLENQFIVETMKTRALDAISRGDFEEALESLDAAIELAPEDPLLQDLRASVRELQIIKGQAPSSQAPVDPDLPDFYGLAAAEKEEEQEVSPPDFEEELFAGRPFENPVESREALIASFGGHWGLSNPVYLEEDAFYQHQASDELSSEIGIFGDIQYYFEGVDRALGVNARYYGNLLNPEGGDILLHQFDLGVILRGFFRETADAHSVLGFRFAAGLLYLNEYVRSEQQPTLVNSLTFGAFYSDAVFRHIFRESAFFKKLVLDVGVDYYYLTLSENSYMIRYNGVLSYEISPTLRLGGAGRFISTAQDIQVLSAWEAGLQLTYFL